MMQGELSAGTVVSFIGYTFTLTFAVSPHPHIYNAFSIIYASWHSPFQVQGLVNTFGDLRGAFAATERINSVLYEAEIDEALAYGLERDIKRQGSHDKNFELFFVNGSNKNNQSLNMHYMSALKSTSSLGSLTWSGDICLEGILIRFTCFVWLWHRNGKSAYTIFPKGKKYILICF